MGYIQNIKKRIFRNRYGINGLPSQAGSVNIEYFRELNIGDTLSPVIVEWMLQKKGIRPEKPVQGTKHLMAVGSLLSMGLFDAAVWGSGILSDKLQDAIMKKRRFYRRKLDIRAVRGPLSRKTILQAGYDCPECYGDPAVLMPLIYTPVYEKKYRKILILHFRDSALDQYKDAAKGAAIPEELKEQGIDCILDPRTDDYRSFIDTLAASESVVSASLHGIILSESYGIPAAFLNQKMDAQLTKFQDWYASTGRECRVSKTIEEAVRRGPAPLPDLSALRDKLMAAFPYDLWES